MNEQDKNQMLQAIINEGGGKAIRQRFGGRLWQIQRQLLH